MQNQTVAKLGSPWAQIPITSGERCTSPRGALCVRPAAEANSLAEVLTKIGGKRKLAYKCDDFNAYVFHIPRCPSNRAPWEINLASKDRSSRPFHSDLSQMQVQSVAQWIPGKAPLSGFLRGETEHRRTCESAEPCLAKCASSLFDA